MLSHIPPHLLLFHPLFLACLINSSALTCHTFSHFTYLCPILRVFVARQTLRWPTPVTALLRTHPSLRVILARLSLSLVTKALSVSLVYPRWSHVRDQWILCCPCALLICGHLTAIHHFFVEAGWFTPVIACLSSRLLKDMSGFFLMDSLIGRHLVLLE